MSKRTTQANDLFAAAEQAARWGQYPGPTVAQLAPLYLACVQRYHAAMMAGDTDTAMAARLDGHDIVDYRHKTLEQMADAQGVEVYGRPCWRDHDDELAAAIAPAIGDLPMWGQVGNFTIEVAGVPVRIELDGFLDIFTSCSLLPGFSIHAVDPNRMFFSPTGYRSFHTGLTHAIQGMTVLEAITTAITSYYEAPTAKGGMGRKLAKLPHYKIDQLRGCALDYHEHYDHQGNRKGSPEAEAAIAAWEATKAKYARGASVSEPEEDDDDDLGDFGEFDDGGRTRIGNTPDDGDEEEEEWPCASCGADLHRFPDGLLTETECGAFCPDDCWDDHAEACEACGLLRADWAAEDAPETDEEIEARRKEGQRRMESVALCICGHKERDHFSIGQRGCHWSTGSGRSYCDCDCEDFTPAVDTLPGLEHVPNERAAAAAEAEGEMLSLDFSRPAPSISANTGAMEKHSPLFRESSANPQLSLF